MRWRADEPNIQSHWYQVPVVCPSFSELVRGAELAAGHGTDQMVHNHAKGEPCTSVCLVVEAKR